MVEFDVCAMLDVQVRADILWMTRRHQNRHLYPAEVPPWHSRLVAGLD